jgi:hypothetical protein
VCQDKEEAYTLKVEFDYEEHPMHPGVPKIPFELQLIPDALFVTNAENDLDFTLICVDATIDENDGAMVIGEGLDLRRLVPMLLSPVDQRKGLEQKKVNMISQPNGNLKCTKMLTVSGTDHNMIFYNESDTGCTGGPIFYNWEVLGIHSERFDGDDRNKGILIKPIVDWVQAWYDKRRQMQVLIDIYVQCNGKNWKKTSNWLTDEDIKEWDGITTDDDGEVTVIELKNNNLKGLIPPCVRQCTKLWKLCLSCNGLYGTYETNGIPGAIGDCPSLRVLKLYNNKLEGPIPTAISQLQHLEVLWLNRNNLTGEIPECLGKLTNLKALYLSYNQFTGSIPENLAELQQLEIMDLGYNSLTGNIPWALGHLRKLKEMYLFYNELTGRVPESFVNLRCLNSIGISNNKLEGIDDARETLREAFGLKVNLRWL